MSAASSSYAAADTRYVPAFLPDAVPARLRLALAIADVLWNPDPEGLVVLDIGCGRGITTCVLAAANPSWQVIGLDLQPAHIAEARELAAEAGLDNCRFLEVDLAELGEAEAAALIPEADLALCYGVWTWVPDKVRDGIVRLLRGRLKAGGIALMGYNALPGSADGIVLQRILEEAARGEPGHEAARGAAALERLERLRAAEARCLPPPATLATIMEHCRVAPAYLAHEYFTPFWRPVFHSDLARALAPARLDYAGPVPPGLGVREISLSAEQRAAIDAMPPAMDRELLRDLFTARSFRKDIFIRGRRPGGRALLAQMRFALIVAPEATRIEFDTHAGRARLPAPAEAALLGALAEGPKSLAELAALPAIGRLPPLDLALILAETQVALPLWREPPGDARALARAAACNQVLVRRLANEAGESRSSLGFAVPALGGAIELVPFELGVAAALQAGVAADPAVLAQHLTAGTDPEVTSGIAGLLRDHLGAWRALGVMPPAAA